MASSDAPNQRAIIEPKDAPKYAAGVSYKVASDMVAKIPELSCHSAIRIEVSAQALSASDYLATL